MNSLHLAMPWWLLLLPLPWLLQRLRHVARGLRRHELRLRHPAVPLIAGMMQHRHRHAHRRMWWRWLVFCLLLLALTQPQWIGRRLPAIPGERDIVFIIDTSVSMLLRDYVVNGKRIDRMTMLRGVLGRFTRQLRGSRISLIVFAERAHTLVPLTRDRALIQAMLDRVQTGMAGRSKSLGEALALAVRQAKRSQRKRRLLILFSDASRSTGSISATEASRLAASEKLRIHTIAIGSADKHAGERRYAGLIYDPASLNRLRAIARATGGRFYQASDTRALKQAVALIEKTEREPATKQAMFETTPLYIWPLATAILILLGARIVSAAKGGD